ncbi:MAG: thioredoxin family protein [Pseudobutyrivibrio sp.]|nr:thioredoxin family protein [Pseudobutyrivibrio sp.]
MYSNDVFPMVSSLIDDDLANNLKGVLQKLTAPVVLCAIVDSAEPTSIELAGFLNHFCSLSDMLTCEFYSPGENNLAEELIDSQFLPATLLRYKNTYQSISFHGIPGGQEINAFTLAIYNCAGPGQEVDLKLKQKIEKINKDVSVQICVSLGCHHCANLVAVCQHMALINPRIHVASIDARLYPDFVAAEKIERVPLLIINNTTRSLGDKTMKEVYELIKNS